MCCEEDVEASYKSIGRMIAPPPPPNSYDDDVHFSSLPRGARRARRARKQHAAAPTAGVQPAREGIYAANDGEVDPAVQAQVGVGRAAQPVVLGVRRSNEHVRVPDHKVRIRTRRERALAAAQPEERSGRFGEPARHVLGRESALPRLGPHGLQHELQARDARPRAHKVAARSQLLAARRVLARDEIKLGRAQLRPKALTILLVADRRLGLEPRVAPADQARQN